MKSCNLEFNIYLLIQILSDKQLGIESFLNNIESILGLKLKSLLTKQILHQDIKKILETCLVFSFSNEHYQTFINFIPYTKI